MCWPRVSPSRFRPLLVSFSKGRKYRALNCWRLEPRLPKARTPRLESAKMKPRKSLTNCWMPARTDTKS